MKNGQNDRFGGSSVNLDMAKAAQLDHKVDFARMSEQGCEMVVSSVVIV